MDFPEPVSLSPSPNSPYPEAGPPPEAEPNPDTHLVRALALTLTR